MLLIRIGAKKSLFLQKSQYLHPATETDRRPSSALGTQFYKVPVNYARECDKNQERVCARIKTRACAGRPKQYLSLCFKLEEENGRSRSESKEIGSARGMNEETKANHQNCHKQTLQKKKLQKTNKQTQSNSETQGMAGQKTKRNRDALEM